MSTELYGVLRSFKLISYPNIELHIELDSVIHCITYYSKIKRKKAINKTIKKIPQFKALQLEVPSQVWDRRTDILR